jgi:carboxyl-terminal processing protease
MNKKISVGVCISLIAIACTVAFVVTWTVSFNMYNDIIPGAVKRDEISAKLYEIDSFVQNNFLGEVNEENIAQGIFSGYISGVGDKNTMYMTADEYAKHSSEKSGRLVTCGIKAEIESSGYIVVTGVYPGSYAESSGVAKNDIITAIDGINVLESGADAAMRFLEGEENSKIGLTVQREGEVLNYSLIRQSMDIVSVEPAVIDDIGFVRITAFNDLTAPQFDAALKTFSQAKVRSLLFDLRSCSSDIYDPEPVSEMVDGLIGGGVIAYSEHRGGVRRDFIVTGDDTALPDAPPIVILTNSATSGAGELMAAILKNHAGAQLIGGATEGNVYLQQTQSLKDGSAIKLTVAKITLASGFDYANVGLTPDSIVEMNSEINYTPETLRGDTITDPQILKAFETIETITSTRRSGING